MGRVHTHDHTHDHAIHPAIAGAARAARRHIQSSSRWRARGAPASRTAQTSPLHSAHLAPRSRRLSDRSNPCQWVHDRSPERPRTSQWASEAPKTLPAVRRRRLLVRCRPHAHQRGRASLVTTRWCPPHRGGQPQCASRPQAPRLHRRRRGCRWRDSNARPIFMFSIKEAMAVRSPRLLGPRARTAHRRCLHRNRPV